MATTIQGMKLADGTEINVAGLTYTSLTSKGNFEITTPPTGKLNLESGDNMALKPVGKVQLDTHKYADPTDQDEFKIAVINDSKTKIEGMKIETAGIKFVTDGADTGMGWDPWTFKVMVKKTTGAVDTWSKMNMHAAAIDLRARAPQAGTGGGIAAQIASCDSEGNENKFKIETSRKKDVFDGNVTYDKTTDKVTNWDTFYTDEGGKGIEIATVNSQVESFGTKEIRRLANSDVFATQRVFEPYSTVYKLAGGVSKLELSEAGADGSTKMILVNELNAAGMWSTKAVKASDGDVIVGVSQGVLQGWYKGNKCKPDNKIMAFNIAVDTPPSGEEDNYVLAPDGKYYEKFDVSKHDLATKLVAQPHVEDKWDYVTQDDDTKDVKLNDAGSVKWIDIINAALYLKKQGLIPSDGTLYK